MSKRSIQKIMTLFLLMALILLVVMPAGFTSMIYFKAAPFTGFVLTGLDYPN